MGMKLSNAGLQILKGWVTAIAPVYTVFATFILFFYLLRIIDKICSNFMISFSKLIKNLRQTLILVVCRLGA